MKQDYCNIPVVFDNYGDNQRAYAMRQWLFENIDPECYDAEDFSTINFNVQQRRIWFSNRTDAALFRLTWS